MKNYIAAGLDPARFWEITPRLYQTEMEGAAKLREYRLSEVWFTAMLPHLNDRPSLQKFTSPQEGNRNEIVRFVEAWDKIDRALERSN